MHLSIEIYVLTLQDSVVICLSVITNKLLKLVEALIVSLIFKKTHGVLSCFTLLKNTFVLSYHKPWRGVLTPGASTLVECEPSLRYLVNIAHAKIRKHKSFHRALVFVNLKTIIVTKCNPTSGVWIG